MLDINKYSLEVQLEVSTLIRNFFSWLIHLLHNSFYLQVALLTKIGDCTLQVSSVTIHSLPRQQLVIRPQQLTYCP